MEGNTPQGENEISTPDKKLSYKKDLWMYFDDINEKFFFERNKAKTLLYIISQKNDIDYEYSESLKYLFNQYITQFDAHQEQINSNIDNEKNTLNKAIKSLINGLKMESELYLNHTKNILENFIKPLEGFIMNQCEISNEFSRLMKSYEKEFMNAYKQVEEKQLNFFQGGKSIENAINKLEKIKYKNKKENYDKNIEEKNINNNDIDIDDEEKEMIEKMNEILEKNKTTSKQLQLDYQEYIKKANVEREKYIKLSENLYDKVQRLDEEFIKQMKTKIIFLTENELKLIDNIKNNISSTLQLSKEINIENEINLFINSKSTKFSHPKLFEYVDYNPYIILRNRKGHIDAIESEISSKIVECLKETFKYDKTKDNLIQEENIKFINDTVNDIWDGNKYNDNKLEKLFKDHIYRMNFLHMLNQYRVEGVFILQNESFQNFTKTLSSILEKSIIDKDYESIKYCMILSQTFYLQTETKKILLQSCMTQNEIWKQKDFWIDIIEYSINEEINTEKEYYVFLSENRESREKRIESAVISNLITFLFNMKLFGYSEDKSKLVIDQFIKKYNIDGNLIYATNISIKEVQEDIIIQSVDSIINNEINQENKIKTPTKGEDINNNKTNDINLNKSDKKEINDDNNIIKDNNIESKKIEDKIKNEIDNPQINS
jgi:hypothetical protein